MIVDLEFVVDCFYEVFGECQNFFVCDIVGYQDYEFVVVYVSYEGVGGFCCKMFCYCMYQCVVDWVVEYVIDFFEVVEVEVEYGKVGFCCVCLFYLFVECDVEGIVVWKIG